MPKMAVNPGLFDTNKNSTLLSGLMFLFICHSCPDSRNILINKKRRLKSQIIIFLLFKPKEESRYHLLLVSLPMGESGVSREGVKYSPSADKAC